MCFQQARSIIRSLGMTLTTTPDREYRVNYLYADERTAYYTNDLTDAVDTARAMNGA